MPRLPATLDDRLIKQVAATMENRATRTFRVGILLTQYRESYVAQLHVWSDGLESFFNGIPILHGIERMRRYGFLRDLGRSKPNIPSRRNSPKMLI